MWVYFHLRNSEERLLDSEGRELADESAVRSAAVNEARAIIADDVRSGVLDLSQRIEVEDNKGCIVCSLPFSEAIAILGA